MIRNMKQQAITKQFHDPGIHFLSPFILRLVEEKRFRRHPEDLDEYGDQHRQLVVGAKYPNSYSAWPAYCSTNTFR